VIAYASDHVFVQIWIGADDKLPRMLRAVFPNDPVRLRHQMELVDWQLDVAVPADAFAPSSVGTATRMDFARPDPKHPPGFKPPPKGKPQAKGTPSKTQ